MLRGFVILLLLASPAYATVMCKSNKGEGAHYWRWRIIDGRKCWYSGAYIANKARLAWPEEKADADDDVVIERKFYRRDELQPPLPVPGSFDDRWGDLPKR
jgi:hypothetical protein